VKKRKEEVEEDEEEIENPVKPMVFREFLKKLRGWEPDLEREPPPEKDWPEYITTLRTDTFDEFIGRYPLSVVDFWAPWCNACKTIAPRIKRLARTYRGKTAFGRVDIDRYRDLAKRYNIMGIPNLVFFSYGERVTGMSGAKSVREIRDKIDDILSRFGD